MSEQALGRLQELRHEYEVGQRRLQELMAQEVSIRETLLRISGAIQVLEELTGDGAQPSSATDVPDDGVPAEPSAPGSMLTVGTLQCGHGGNIAVTTAKARLKVGGADVLLTGEEVGLTFVTCQNKTTTTTPAPSPCLSQAVTAGTSTKVNACSKKR